MKKFFTSAILVAGLLTSSNCFAALEYSFDQEAKVFTAKSEEIIELDEGANLLKVAFTKEYNFGDKKVVKSGKLPNPTMHVHMSVEGKVQYEFANNANYWQEHNYTYEEMGILKEREAEREAKEKEKQKARAEGRKIASSEPVVETKDELEQRKLSRNASTLIYLEVKHSSSREKTGKALYDFENPVEKELKESAEQQKRLQAQADKERLAKLQSKNPEEAEKLRQKIAEEEARKKVEERAALVEEVKAARAAFNKYLAEQKEADKDIVYTSIADAKVNAGDNFWSKVQDSSKKRVPLFFEVKFWKGGSNQRLWLKTDKLQELKELLAYDLYTDKTHLQQVKSELK